jgi:phospholysine phosphohistidine inorganic pyrophosphate phosphatase
MIGDDLEADVAGAKSCGLKTILVRTGKFRESALNDALVKPDAVVDSLGDVPDYLARTL